MKVKELNVSLREYSNLLDKEVVLVCVPMTFQIERLDVLVIREADCKGNRTGAWSSFDFAGMSIANSNNYGKDTTNLILFHKHTYSI